MWRESAHRFRRTYFAKSERYFRFSIFSLERIYEFLNANFSPTRVRCTHLPQSQRDRCFHQVLELLNLKTWEHNNSNVDVSDAGAALGLESGDVLDEQLTASFHGPRARYARLNSDPSWCAGANQTSGSHLQVDLRTPHVIRQVGIVNRLSCHAVVPCCSVLSLRCVCAMPCSGMLQYTIS